MKLILALGIWRAHCPFRNKGDRGSFGCCHESQNCRSGRNWCGQCGHSKGHQLGSRCDEVRFIYQFDIFSIYGSWWESCVRLPRFTGKYYTDGGITRGLACCISQIAVSFLDGCVICFGIFQHSRRKHFECCRAYLRPCFITCQVNINFLWQTNHCWSTGKNEGGCVES